MGLDAKMDPIFSNMSPRQLECALIVSAHIEAPATYSTFRHAARVSRPGTETLREECFVLSKVLVLNATYEPLNVVSVQRAIILLLKDKAELIEATKARLRAEQISFPVPSVIRLVTYVRLPHNMALPLTRRTVLARDNYQCQYCGCYPGKGELSIDHILPRSRGGQNTWENVVAACKRCNQRKGNRTPEEANMPLISKPTRPRYVAVVMLRQDRAAESWLKYMF